MYKHKSYTYIHKELTSACYALNSYMIELKFNLQEYIGFLCDDKICI